MGKGYRPRGEKGRPRAVSQKAQNEEAAAAAGELSDGASDPHAPTVSDMANEDVKNDTPGQTDNNEDTPA